MLTAEENQKTLYVVHCVDTEGPLYESTTATFQRLRQITGIDLDPTPQNLETIVRGELDLGGEEAVAQVLVGPQLLRYNDSWDKLDSMLDELLSSAFRNRYPDSHGNGWCFNWFVLDHVYYLDNPRRRDIGYHNIFDHYSERLTAPSSSHDEIHWHFHPMSTYREAHLCATSYLRSPHLLETLCRRVIDRSWFPTCFRAGFHTERPDSHWFLEQWVPFDFSNQSIAVTVQDQGQTDMVDGRFGDWRRAPSDWSAYHPSHDDYQTTGQCNRTIFRCLNVGTRARLLNQAEVDSAFARANRGIPTILAFTDHDFRDMRNDVSTVYRMLLAASEKYPQVQWLNSGARSAAQKALSLPPSPPAQLDISFTRLAGSLRMSVRSDVDCFGPQPFLALKSYDKTYLSDNFDFDTPRRSWSYTFDEQTVNPMAVEQLGVAFTNRSGVSRVTVVNNVREILTGGEAHFISETH